MHSLSDRPAHITDNMMFQICIKSILSHIRDSIKVIETIKSVTIYFSVFLINYECSNICTYRFYSHFHNGLISNTDFYNDFVS